MYRNFVMVLMSTCLVFRCVPSGAAIITVDPEGRGDYEEIPAAIDAAEDGDTVLVKPGLYRLRAGEPLSFQGRSIVLRSEGGREVTRIVPEDGPVVVFRDAEGADAVFEGFSLAGAVHLSGASATIRDSTLVGLECQDASPLLSDCTVSRNMQSGVFLSGDSAPRLVRCTIVSNRARVVDGSGRGGALYCGAGSTPFLEACVLNGNFAEGPGRGGAVYCEQDAAPCFLNCVIYGNLAAATSDNAGMGGAIYCESGAAPVLVHCTVTGNIADVLGQPPSDSGGLYLEGGGVRGHQKLDRLGQPRTERPSPDRDGSQRHP